MLKGSTLKVAEFSKVKDALGQTTLEESAKVKLPSFTMIDEPA